jgi:surfactin synthase thioesterase subunit
MTVPSTVWLQRIGDRVDGLPRLFCFPHAGGSASFFRGWAAQLAEYQIYAACYPGRGGRISEPPPDNLRAMAVDISEAIAHQGSDPVVLFGHSMGAVVAFECARSLCNAGIPVIHLFVSGSSDGEQPVEQNSTDDASDADIIRQLVDLGGTDPQIAADPEFQKLVLPYVRADTRIFHAYRMDPQPQLTCPVTAIVGDEDVDADRRPWRQLTTGVFDQLTVIGDHFYLISKPPFSILRSALHCPSVNNRQISAVQN